jgi:hypothetical protein
VRSELDDHYMQAESRTAHQIKKSSTGQPINRGDNTDGGDNKDGAAHKTWAEKA